VKTNKTKEPEMEHEINEILRHWRDMSDTDFWKEVGDYVKDKKPSLEQQLTMMGLVERLSSNVRFIWSHRKDRDALIEALIKAAQAGSSADIYPKVVTMTYNNEALPRNIAADLCADALHKLLVARV
jgi:hypothetical protein